MSVGLKLLGPQSPLLLLVLQRLLHLFVELVLLLALLLQLTHLGFIQCLQNKGGVILIQCTSSQCHPTGPADNCNSLPGLQLSE